ncbi:MAG: TfuA-like protein [Dongiaceae bacterium]
MIVFAGPTLSPAEAPGFEMRAPAAQGDLYRAAREQPTAIGLIDGYFDERPAVWHKEILWALAEGIPVYGAASMGALRAAELHAFGMRGVGRIFEDYRDGRLVADDAVALVHGPPETGYAALSEPLVNIVATLARAVREGVVTSTHAEKLGERARALHYRERTWRVVLEESTHDALAAWLPTNQVDQKRFDALAMLAAMKQAAPLEAPAFRFQRTDLWQDVVDRAGPFAGLSPVEREGLLDEIRLAPEIEDLHWRAMARRLLRRPESTLPANGRAISNLRQRLGLYRKESLDRWLAINGLGEAAFGRLAAEEASLAAARDLHWIDGLVDELRLAGRLGPILDRARRKQAVLAARGREDGAPHLVDGRTDIGLAGLLGWYCARRGVAFPDDVDAYGAALGFADRAGFHRALSREWLYCALQPEDDRPKAGGPVSQRAGDG